MNSRCDEIRELVPELALGIVEGEERGRALEHLADCPECRRRVEDLAEVADQLLLLAPHKEVPVGFESRVLGRVLPPAPPPRRRRRFALVLTPAAAALAAVAITLTVVSSDIRTASHYRHTLDQANGKEFESYALRAGDSHVGTVFSYEGSPSWVHIDVDPAHRAGLTTADLVTDDGSQLPLRWFHLDSAGGSGGSIPVDPNKVSVLRLTGAPGTESLVARFGD
jgi:hypothetical protein